MARDKIELLNFCVLIMTVLVILWVVLYASKTVINSVIISLFFALKIFKKKLILLKKMST